MLLSITYVLCLILACTLALFCAYVMRPWFHRKAVTKAKVKPFLGFFLLLQFLLLFLFFIFGHLLAEQMGWIDEEGWVINLVVSLIGAAAICLPFLKSDSKEFISAVEKLQQNAMGISQ
ncbi:hypothetical protein C4546_04455 [Candidatus Parcubacteria bacterium]|jgi:ABC-type phosphate transport system permease subunit|nr:MAG: hypothetical protein C4546_04455 [Candidatus Parcubacteria bacterium]